MSQPVNTDRSEGTSPAEFSIRGVLLKLILLPGLAVLLIILTIVWLSRPGDDVDPLPMLLEAARSRQSEKGIDVRLAALEAIAVLASKGDPAELRNNARLAAVLLEAAEDEQRQVRERAAFALGVVGGDRAEDCLERMLADAQAEVRYNAATGLARHGNPKCIGVLQEMLDPQQAATRRTLIQLNALRAIGKLADANPTTDLALPAKAVERLTRADAPAEVSAKAAEILRKLPRRKGTSDGVRS